MHFVKQRLFVNLRDGMYIGVGWLTIACVAGDPLAYTFLSWYLTFKYRHLLGVPWHNIAWCYPSAVAIETGGILIGYIMQYPFFWN